MISKTQISKRTEKKRNTDIIDVIGFAKKKGLLDLAKTLSGPKSNYSQVNVSDLDSVEGDKVLVKGVVLGNGDINKKLEVGALRYSGSALEKLKKAGCKVMSIKEFVESNKKLEGVKVI